MRVPQRNYRLTVVVPTRNRMHSVVRLLENMCSQTLSPDAFEVVIVDDGSVPSLDEPTITRGLPFAASVIRRTSAPGAHASRFAGLREARGERVLFLDDDVLLEPDVLTEHSGKTGVFAIGPILYHPDAKKTAYQRYQTKRYSDHAAATGIKKQILASEIYICNSSGPRELFIAAFEAVDSRVRGMSVPGDGMDEELLSYELRGAEGCIAFLPRALILHLDTKTIREVRREKQHRAQVQCRLILQIPGLTPSFPLMATSHRKFVVRLFWKIPGMFRLIADLFVLVADLPGQWVPKWICYPPLAIAFWEGINSVVPRYEQLSMALRDNSEAK